MKVRTLALPLLLAFALLAAVPLPVSISQTASATHFGIVECAAVGNPVSDGAITADEYDESYFDDATKVLVYFTCDNSTERLLHVGLVTLGDGWVGLGVQARDIWDGTLNEIRLSRVASSNTVHAEDGLRNVTLGSFESDVSLGGSVDVWNATVGIAGAATVYEFAVPLLSSDPADSQLQSNGPFHFALEANSIDSDPNSDATAGSELQALVLQSDLSRGMWTGVELSIAPSVPLTESRMLVSLRDERGYPLPGMTLEVFVPTTFGFLDLGSVVTNDQGVAQVTYAPRDEGAFVVGAAYEGGGGFLGSVAWRVLEVAASAGGGDLGSGFLDSGNALELRPIEAVVVLLVGGVWATYAYALFVTRQTLRPEKPKAEGAPRKARRWRREE